jgi:prevent-host-death family protein
LEGHAPQPEVLEMPSEPSELSITEVRRDLPGLVRRVEAGEPVTITRRGRPVAVMVSVARYEHLAGRQPDFVEALTRFRHDLDLTDAEVDELFTGLRERSSGREVAW